MSNKPNTTTTPIATAEKIAQSKNPSVKQMIAEYDRSLEPIGGSPEEIAIALHNDAVKPRDQQTGHTPGPWRAVATSILVGSIDDPQIVAETATGDLMNVIDPDECEANARLIAAAPTMLQALKDLAAQIQLGKLNVRKDFSLMNAHACATKAIYQAEGK